MQDDYINEDNIENIKVVKMSNGKYAKYIECNEKIEILFAGKHLGRGYTARIRFRSRDEVISCNGMIDLSGKAASGVRHEDTVQYSKDIKELNELGIM